MAIRVSVVIPVWNRVELTAACLASLAEHTTDVDFELVVVDNGSTDATPDLLGALGGDVRVVSNERNLGFGEACNQGAAGSTAEYLLFLNNDTRVGPGWLGPLVSCLDEDRGRGAAQPRLLYPDGRLNDAGGLVFAGGEAWNYGKGSRWPFGPRYSYRRSPDYLSGACLLVRRRAFEEVGGFDPRYAPAYYEDVDLSFGLRAAGWDLVYEPASTIIHVEGGTAGTDTSTGLKSFQVRNRARFADKWRDELAGRPALDPAIVERRAHHPGGRGAARSVLVIDPFPPLYDRAAGSLRLLNLVRTLRADGHAVSWYAAGDAVERERYQAVLGALGVPLFGLSRSEAPTAPSAIDGWAAEHGPGLETVIVERAVDLVVLSPWTVAEVVLPPLRAAFPDLPVVVDTCDLHFVREERATVVKGDQRELAAVKARRRRELTVYGAADAVVCASESDATALSEALPDARSTVIGLALPELDPGPGFDAREGLVFVGNANHEPNLDAIRWWRQEIGPRLAARLPGVSLTVVGNDPAGAMAALTGPNLDVRGWVADTLPFLHRARLSVAPLRYGAGANGKVAEALAAGLPTVLTSRAAEGLGILDGVHAAVADDPEAFVEAVASLYEDEQRWSRLRAAGRSHAQQVAGMTSMAEGARRLLDLVGARLPETPVTISLVMNVRNEGTSIGAAIAACAGVDEVVVADMGSTDDTVAVAEAAGARVVAVEESGYCETARQAAIDAATATWVLVVDADERLSADGITALRAVAAAAPPDVSAYRIPRPVYVGTSRLHGTGWGLDVERHPRFFRRSDVSWPARIHSTPEFRARTAELPPGTSVWLDHFCFADVATAIDKFNRYSSVEAEERDVAGLRTGGPVDALCDGITEFVARYQPEVDGALSLTLSMGMFLYRFLTTMKLQERRGWPDAGPLPSAESMQAAWRAFAQTLVASEAGAPLVAPAMAR